MNYKFSLRLLFLKPIMANSDIETLLGSDNSTITISCKEGGEVSFQHNNGQVERLAEQIEDLRDQSAQQFNDLKDQSAQQFNQSAQQVEQLAEQIDDLREQSAQQFNDLKELMKKHMEGN